MRDRYKITPAVFVAIIQDKSILLVKRTNTGFLDGFYDLPSGHVEPGETILQSAVRELSEETSLETHEKDLELFHISQNDTTPEHPYLFFMLRAKQWSGQPKINEPEKSDDVGFFPFDNLPIVTPHVGKALSSINSQTVTFSYFAPGEYDGLRK